MNTTTLPAAPDNASESQNRVPGNKGIWAGITCEFVEFTVLFAVYFIARAHFPQAFHDGAQRLSVTAGTVITLLMITSSYFIACSVNAIRQDKQPLGAGPTQFRRLQREGLRRPRSAGQLLARHRHHLAGDLSVVLRTGLNDGFKK